MHPESARAKAINFVRGGTPIKIAAEAANVSVKTLRRWCKQEGIAAPKPVLTRRQEMEVKTSYALARAEFGDCLTRHEIMASIAETMCVDVHVIREALQR